MAGHMGVPVVEVERYYAELVACGEFLREINGAIRGVPEFGGKQFQHVDELRVLRTALYVVMRVARPAIVVETGVLQGLGSAFVLLALEHNKQGVLHSIDLPPSHDDRLLGQGTEALPGNKGTGWIIPEALRGRHRLHVGRAQELLPRVLAAESPVDVFIHDSDHSYTHMMFEMSLAWYYLKAGGWLLVDNIESNHAFADFSRAVRQEPLELASFDTPERVWKHGMLRARAFYGDDGSGHAQQ
jgi:predicted O-methyltransferase YrrM